METSAEVPQADAAGTRNLIINYLPQTLSEEEFKGIFMSCGTVIEAKICRDRQTGYSYGFGFVTYETQEECEKAIATLNGLQVQHKKLKVAYSRSGTGKDIKSANVYMKNVPLTMTNEELESIMTAYGEIINCRHIQDKGKNTGKGIAFVLFGTREQAQTAIDTLNNTTLSGGTAPLSMSFAEGNEAKIRAPPANPAQAMGFMPGAQMAAQMAQWGAMGGMGAAAMAGRGFMGARGARGARGAGGPVKNMSMGRGLRYNPMSGMADFSGADMTGMTGAEDMSGMDMSGFMGAGGGGMMGGTAAAMGMMKARGRGGRGGMGMGRGGYGVGGGAGAKIEGHTLFVYNVGTTCQDDDLYNLFAPFGTVTDVDIVRDEAKNNNAKYAFVTYSDYSEAEYAIANLNGYSFTTRPLQVRFHTKTK